MSRPAAKRGAVLKIHKVARIIYENVLPIDAAALNEGIPTWFRS